MSSKRNMVGGFRWVSRHIDRRELRRGIVIGSVVGALVLVLWAGDLFAQVRQGLNDTYFVESETSGSVVIVALDDASFAEFGRSQTEWPRIIYADLVRILSSAQARVIAFDLLFSEQTADDHLLAAAIEEARSSDARSRTIMPVVGGQVLNSDAQAIAYGNTMLPTRRLRDVVDYLGFTNSVADADGRIRRQPSLVYYDDEIGLSFSLAAYAAYLRVPSEAIQQVFTVEAGALHLTGDKTIPTDALGIWQQYYFGPPSTTADDTFPVYSLRAVINQEVDASVFEGKIVLIGLVSATGATDRYLVPWAGQGTMMAGVEIHANAIESILQSRALNKPSPLVEAVIIMALAIGASVIYAQLRWYWMIFAAVGLVLGWVLAMFVVFGTRLTVVDLFSSNLALIMPLLANIGVRISLEVNRRQRSEFFLASILEVSKHRLDREKIASSIGADVQKVLQTERGGVWLWHAEQDALKLTYAWPGKELRVDQGLDQLFARLEQEKRLIATPDTVAVPFVWQGRLLGGIVARSTSSHSLTDRARDTLTSLALQIAPSLENARLYLETLHQKTLVDAILLAAPVAIIELDSNLALRKANAAAEASLSMPVAPHIGKPVMDLFKAADISAPVRERIQRQLHTLHPWHANLLHNEVAYEMAATPLDADRGWVIIMNDVSTLYQLNELKTRMIRMAAHDLQNPLASILGYTHLIRTSEVPQDEKTLEFVQIVDRNANRMRNIVADILNLEQLRSSQLQYDSIDIAALLRDDIDFHRQLMQEKSQTCVTEIADGLPPFFGDRRQMSQAVTNLLGNAIKYTPDGGTITVRLTRKEDHLHLEVADTGYGIPKDAQANLFTEFYKVRTAATAHIEGTGLGLSLVKSIIKAHDGRIWFESEEGVGTTFYVDLPIISGDSKDAI